MNYELKIARRLITPLIALILPIPAQGIERDKAVHFVTSAALTTVLYLGTAALFNRDTPKARQNKTVPFLWSAMAVQAAGVAWEGAGGFDGGDLKANGAGSLGAGAVIWAFDL